MQQTTACMLRQRELAARLRVSLSALRRMRQRGTGPEWVGIGKQIRYPVAGVEDWVERNLRRPEPRQGTQRPNP